MSLLTLQYGQCGNQIGETLFSTIYEDICNETCTPYLRNALNKWFNIQINGKWEARSILIDTETKVIYSRKKTPYDFKNVIVGPYGGSANNWAFGYNYQSQRVIDSLLDKVRQEIEKTDCTITFLNILGSSGGTGSGVGSRITEELRTEYPNKTIINATVLPYKNGEIVTQDYNTILCLAKLHISSDTSILFENEMLHELCSSGRYDNINFNNLNHIIAFQLASVFQPISGLNNTQFLSQLTPHPLFKYIQLKSSYLNSQYFKFESNQSWTTMLNSLKKQLQYKKNNKDYSSLGFKKKNIVTEVITRGKDKPTNEAFDLLKSSQNFVNWIPPNDYYFHHHEIRSLCGKQKTVTVVSNDNSICYYLNPLLEEAWTLFTKKAYLHHYLKYELGEDEFQEAFQILENVLAGYSHL